MTSEVIKHQLIIIIGTSKAGIGTAEDVGWPLLAGPDTTLRYTSYIISLWQSLLNRKSSVLLAAKSGSAVICLITDDGRLR